MTNKKEAQPEAGDRGVSKYCPQMKLRSQRQFVGRQQRKWKWLENVDTQRPRRTHWREE
jgi:hypothetical protein